MRDELPLAPILALTDERFFVNQGTRTAPFVEVDGRPGYHAQARLRAGAHGHAPGRLVRQPRRRRVGRAALVHVAHAFRGGGRRSSISDR